MSAHFSINLLKPAAKVVEYTTVLMLANSRQLNHLNVNDEIFISGAAQKSPDISIKVAELEKNFELRTLLYCGFVHPHHFSVYGNVDNWYDTAAICSQLRSRIPVYKKEGLSTLEGDVVSELPFITKIQRSGIDIGKEFPEESVERYEKYMTLLKRYETLKLLPPLDVRFVWRAHMLDNKAYVSATKEYFGKVMVYQDHMKTGANMKEINEQTERLWKKHYGSSMSDDGYLFWPWYNNSSASQTLD